MVPTFPSRESPPDEVNFWRPSGSRFRVLPAGAPFFFRLKAPRNAIGGFGFFSRYLRLEAWRAWQVFDDLNGAPDLPTMLTRLAVYRHGECRLAVHPGITADPTPARAGDFHIGCIVISQPTFFTPDEWVRDDAQWSPNIVVGKGIELLSGEGRRILAECFEHLRARAGAGGARSAHVPHRDIAPELLEAAEAALRGHPILVRPRLGRDTFRLSVVSAYEGICAVTNEHSLPVLVAARVRPFSFGGPHRVDNGLLLRSDLHRLFDLGYVTVTPDHRLRVSGSLMDDFHNGREYERYHGRHIH